MIDAPDVDGRNNGLTQATYTHAGNAHPARFRVIKHVARNFTHDNIPQRKTNIARLRALWPKRRVLLLRDTIKYATEARQTLLAFPMPSE